MALDCGALTPVILHSTVEVVLGKLQHHLPDELADKMRELTLADLDLVVRPGTETRDVASRLLALLETKKQDGAKESAEKSAKKSGSTRRGIELPTADVTHPEPSGTERELLEGLTRVRTH